MKRAKRLMPKIMDMDNLRLAFYKARKSAGWSHQVLAYSNHLEENLKKLQDELASGQVTVGHYHYFKIFDPKERQICAAPFEQRVLHHALMNVCHAYFERKQIYHSYASRKGKGTHAAVKQATVFINQYRYYLKLDVKKFFDSISHDVLKRQLAAMFKEERLLGIFYQIIDSYEASIGRGVPIGNLTSQYFANHILSVGDHYVLEVLQNAAYVRYMDDMVIFNNDKERLLKIRTNFENYLFEHLEFRLKPVCLNSSDKGLPFLGFLIFPQFEILLSQRSRRRFIRKSQQKLEQLQANLLSQAEYGRQTLALAAFTDLANSKKFRNFVYQRLSS